MPASDEAHGNAAAGHSRPASWIKRIFTHGRSRSEVPGRLESKPQGRAAEVQAALRGAPSHPSTAPSPIAIPGAAPDNNEALSSNPDDFAADDDRSSTSSIRKERRKRREKKEKESHSRSSIGAFLSHSYDEFAANLKKSAVAPPPPPASSPSPPTAGLSPPSDPSSSDLTRRRTSVSSSSKVKVEALGQALNQSAQSIKSSLTNRKTAGETFKQMRDGGDASTLAVPTVAVQPPPADETPDVPAPPSLSAVAPAPSPDRELSELPEPSCAEPDAAVPEELQKGEAMLKVTQKKVAQRIFRLDPDLGQILWDSKRKNTVHIESIREVRTGASASSYRTSLSISASHEKRWISIIYQTGGAYKAIHLIALSDESLERWRRTLEALQCLRKELINGLLDQKHQLWLRQHWKGADSSKDERLDFGEVVKLCRRIGIESGRRFLRDKFQEADVGRRGYLDFEDFQRFVGLLKQRAEVALLFLRWADVGGGEEVVESAPVQSDDAATMATFTAEPIPIEPLEALDVTALYRKADGRAISLESFTAFMMKEQGATSPSRISSTFHKYYDGERGAMLLDGFNSFLHSSDDAILGDGTAGVEGSAAKSRAMAKTAEELLALSAAKSVPQRAGAVASVATMLGPDKAVQDMDHPLSDYYISSSHNTYLVGGQWKGDSTVEGYIRALQQGARSVELDCWDGPNGVPHNTHGHTLTKRVPFSDVITAIDRYAFVASPYPLILSLEVHNDVPQQEVMARILRETFGDKLVSQRIEGIGSQDALPSPNELRGKIMVKAKNLQLVEKDPSRPSSGNMTAETLNEDDMSTSTDATESDGDLLSKGRGLVRSVTGRRSGGDAAATLDRRPSLASTPSSKKTKLLMSASLVSLLVYTVGVKHRGFNKKETYAVEHMVSLSERTARRYVKTAPEDLIKHNLTHLTRVYPSMASIARLNASTNFLPHDFWATGCQLVALNWQTLDLGFALNQAFFSRNGRCGYVLKPEALRVKELSKSSGQRMRFAIQVKIISAQQLPRFRDAVKDKDADDSDVISPFASITAYTPESWGRQPYRSASSSTEEAGLRGQFVKGGPVSSSSASILSTGDASIAASVAASVATSPPASDAKSLVPPPSPGRIPRSTSDVSTATTTSSASSGSARLNRARTSIVKSNGFNPIWDQVLVLHLDVPSGSGPAFESLLARANKGEALDAYTLSRGLLDLAFLRFEVGEENGTGDGGCLASYAISIGAMQPGYRHLPLFDAQLSQYMFSTLFVHSQVRFVGVV